MSERLWRQLDILHPDKCKEKVYIIGAGATGSFTALSLAKMGLTNITIFDHDTIEEHNFPNQLFPIRTKGMNKALAVKEIVKEFTEVDIEAVPEKYTKQELKGIVISALDSMKGRKDIYKQCKDNLNVRLLIDPRTGAEMFRILTLNPNMFDKCENYEKTLFSDNEALRVPCTAQAIIYSVLMVSSHICNQVKRLLMDQTYKEDIFMDLPNNYSYAN
jgi:molybdopterin/thiamine biosynthesis adenylyltransferase